MKVIADLRFRRGLILEPLPIPVLSGACPRSLGEPVLGAFLPMNELTEFGD